MHEPTSVHITVSSRASAYWLMREAAEDLRALGVREHLDALRVTR